MSEPLTELVERLSRIEATLQELVRERVVKEWYSTAEAAVILAKSEYTVREWCRNKRVVASKRPYPRGASSEWLIGHDELMRIRNLGLLPIPVPGGGS